MSLSIPTLTHQHRSAFLNPRPRESPLANLQWIEDSGEMRFFFFLSHLFLVEKGPGVGATEKIWVFIFVYIYSFNFMSGFSPSSFCMRFSRTLEKNDLAFTAASEQL